MMIAILLLLASETLSVMDQPQISVGLLHAGLILPNGDLFGWGTNIYGERGQSALNTARYADSFPGVSNALGVSAGKFVTCVNDGGAARCVGENNYGQLGDSTTTNRDDWVTVDGLATGTAAVLASRNHACALKTNGGMLCWGYRSNGRLGKGDSSPNSGPVAVLGYENSGVAMFSLASENTCIVTTSGAAKCCGRGTDGRNGDGTTITRYSMVQVQGYTSGVATVACGLDHCCLAMSSSGGVRCWGGNRGGVLGDGTTTSTSANPPVTPTGLATGNFKLFDGVGKSSFAIDTSDNSMMAWGKNKKGQLGNLSDQNSLVPISFVAGAYREVTSSEYGTVCVIKMDDTAWCIGRDRYGALGDGDYEYETSNVLEEVVFSNPNAQSAAPTSLPSTMPTTSPFSSIPTMAPSPCPECICTEVPTLVPSKAPTGLPTGTAEPSTTPTLLPTSQAPSSVPSVTPTKLPTSQAPSGMPSVTPTKLPTSQAPSTSPSKSPTNKPTTLAPTIFPTRDPVSKRPTAAAPPPPICTPGIVTCCLTANEEVTELFLGAVDITNQIAGNRFNKHEAKTFSFPEPTTGTTALAIHGREFQGGKTGSAMVQCTCTRAGSPWNGLKTTTPGDWKTLWPRNDNSFAPGWYFDVFPGVIPPQNVGKLKTDSGYSLSTDACGSLDGGLVKVAPLQTKTSPDWVLRYEVTGSCTSRRRMRRRLLHFKIQTIKAKFTEMAEKAALLNLKV